MSFQSDAIISAAAGRFGTIDYSRWQALRWQFYSYVTYPLLGASELNFFGNVAGQAGVTLADTNLPKAGSFGQNHFLIKTISTNIKLPQNDLTAFTRANIANIDTQTLASDYLAGFVQAGVLEFNIGARPFAVIPRPFQYAPGCGNDPIFANAFVNDPSAAPLGDVVVGTPVVTQTQNKPNCYVVDPNILIEAEQQFDVRIRFPSGLVPVIGTGVVTNATVPLTLKVGVIFDGILLRPMQ